MEIIFCFKNVNHLFSLSLSLSLSLSDRRLHLDDNMFRHAINNNITFFYTIISLVDTSPKKHTVCDQGGQQQHKQRRSQQPRHPSNKMALARLSVVLRHRLQAVQFLNLKRAEQLVLYLKVSSGNAIHSALARMLDRWHGKPCTSGAQVLEVSVSGSDCNDRSLFYLNFILNVFRSILIYCALDCLPTTYSPVRFSNGHNIR